MTHCFDADSFPGRQLHPSGPSFVSSTYSRLIFSSPVPKNQWVAKKDDVLPNGTVIKAGEYVRWGEFRQFRNLVALLISTVL